MRGKSNTKSRLRNAGYKCNLCGRRVIDAAALERHQKTIHSISTRTNKVLKAKPTSPKPKLSAKGKDKAVNDLRHGLRSDTKAKLRISKKVESLRIAASKPTNKPKEMSNRNTVHVNKIVKNVIAENHEKIRKKGKDNSKKVQFECPVCKMSFGVYFTAHKHIQKFHPVDAEGKKVSPNSTDMVQPIRVEQCYRCSTSIRSNEHHVCLKVVEEVDSGSLDYACSGCSEAFVNLKTFDVHVAGLHSEGVDSMFFPTKIEYINWRLDMEWQTNSRFSINGEYDSKKIYRCNYAHKRHENDKVVNCICPSSLVVQDFSKGIQVHFYNKHYGHPTKDYTLSSKYNKYSITSFLKNTNDDTYIKNTSVCKQLSDEDLHSEFKKLMDGIVLNSTDVDSDTLTKLIEKALDMSALITDSGLLPDTSMKTKPLKTISDKEIAEELQVKTALSKRRSSVDNYETPSNPAKRTRNKSLYVQSNDDNSPKILNAFSLASKHDNNEVTDDIDDTGSVKSDGNEVRDSQRNTITPESLKTVKKQTSFNESQSFNDSYKDFIDKNFIGRSDKVKNTRTRSMVKTKLGEFKQTSPKKQDKDDLSTDLSPKNVGDMKLVTSDNTGIEDTNTTAKANNPNVNILSVETPDVTITKVKTINTPPRKVTTQINTPKSDAPKVNNKANYSHLVDPLQVQITKMTRSTSSPTVEVFKGNTSKVNTRSVTSALDDDPLELDASKTNSRKTPNILRTYKVSPKASKPHGDVSKLNTTKVEVSKVNSAKVVSPEATKVSEDVVTSANSYTGIIKHKKVKDLKYEVREQENDCNILVLKL